MGEPARRTVRRIGVWIVLSLVGSAFVVLTSCTNGKSSHALSLKPNSVVRVTSYSVSSAELTVKFALSNEGAIKYCVRQYEHGYGMYSPVISINEFKYEKGDTFPIYIESSYRNIEFIPKESKELVAYFTSNPAKIENLESLSFVIYVTVDDCQGSDFRTIRSDVFRFRDSRLM